MILVDSSVWIDLFNGAAMPEVELLADLLEDAAAPLGMPGLVLFEVLRGFRQDRGFEAARPEGVAALKTTAWPTRSSPSTT